MIKVAFHFRSKYQVDFFDFEGVAGGTASGKTTVCDMIIQQLHDHRVVLINQVNFFFLKWFLASSYSYSVIKITHYLYYLKNSRTPSIED